MIKNTADIHAVKLLDVVSQHVELKKRGSEWVGCCPFHTEKTPSFSVSPAKSIYKCFGCGAGGNSPVSFLMDLKGLTYPEALEEVAVTGRIVVEYETSKPEVQERMKAQSEQRKTLMQVMADAEALYFDRYLNQHPAGETVDFAGREYTWENRAKFRLSEAKEARFLSTEKIAPAEQMADRVTLNLIRMDERNGGHYDFFRDRFLFPIHNHTGKVVALAGRKPVTDTNHENPKYLNSPESDIFRKEEVLYGLYQSRKQITNDGFAYLVEGYTDVISMHQAGIGNVVASCGTAFTEKQADLLKRFTEHVFVLRDGDAAGLKAAVRDVELLIAKGFEVTVCLLPDGEDPDSFVRAQGKKGMEFFLSEHKENGLIWRCMREWSDKDVFAKERAFRMCGQLLAQVESPSMRETYIRELTKPGRMGSVKTQIKDQIEAAEAKLPSVADSFLSPEQQHDVVNYGIYEGGKCYFVTSDAGNTGFAVSNFTIKPIMLIIGAERSQRLIELENEYGKKIICNLPSEAMTTLGEFKKIVEGKGNFHFTGKPEHFDKVKGKVYQMSHDCYPLNTMGWNKAGFYIWGNGLSVNGEFRPVNEYGIVDHDKVQYFLPAFSKIQDSIIGDDSDDSFEFERKFAFYGDRSCITFEEWSKMMVDVHDFNGMIGVAYILASCYRDIIFGKLSFFPHINLFGPPATGKSFMARSLMAMFGREADHDPFNLLGGTPVAFKRRLAQVANALVWFDEYSNGVDLRRVEALKGAYDGAGHERGIADNSSNRTKTTKVRSALVITGQEQPTQDVALFTRCISLNFPKIVNTTERQSKAKELKDIEKTGQLTQITQFLLKFRKEVQDEFSETFERVQSRAMQTLIESDEIMPTDRIVKNYMVLISIVMVLKDRLKFGFPIDAFMTYCMNMIVEQSRNIAQEDENSVWWRIVDYLLSSGDIRHHDDVLIEEKSRVTLHVEGASRKDKSATREKNFGEATQLLFIRFNKVHQLYLERHLRTRQKKGLDLQALQYYLKQSEAYVGYCRAKKFGDNAYSCYVFRVDGLPIELPLSMMVKEESTMF